MPQVQSGLDYQVYIRDKSFNILQMLDDYESLEYTARYNDVGEWVLVTSKFSPSVKRLVQGNGLVVVNTQAQTVVMSGPIRSVEKHSAASPNLTISGWDDMVWIKRRKAWPVQGYCGAVLSDAPIRYYRLGDGGFTPPPLIVTTVAADAGSQRINGVYLPTNNALTQGEPGSVPFDTDGLFNPNGTTYIECATTGMPTGNSAITLECTYSPFGSAPSANGYLVDYGPATPAPHNFIGIWIDTTAAVHLDVGAGSVTSAAISLSSYHHIVGTWNGTTLQLWIDNVSAGTATPGAQAIPATGTLLRIAASCAAVAANILPSPGGLDEVAIYAGALSGTRITAHFNRSGAVNAAAPFYLSAFDTQTGLASTLIYHYVDYNLGPHSQVDRFPGDIQNFARPPLTMAADPLIGATVGFAARFDGLLVMCQLFAAASEGLGTRLGFTLVQSSAGGGNPGALTFTIFAPVSRPNVVFSEALGNLADYTYTLDESTDNFPIIGGSGTGTARTFYGLSFDGESLRTFGRIEGFVNFSGSGNQTALGSVAIDEFTKNANKTNVDATPAEASHMVYGVDYAMGDQITVVVDGDTITDIVREAHLTITVAEGAWWRPVIGSVNARQAQQMLREMLREMRASHGKILYLEGVQ